MYREAEKGFFVDEDEVLGIFDMDNTTVNKHTRDFLNRVRREGKAVYLAADIPKSFLLLSDGRVLVTGPNTRIMKRRLEGFSKDK